MTSRLGPSRHATCAAALTLALSYACGAPAERAKHAGTTVRSDSKASTASSAAHSAAPEHLPSAQTLPPEAREMLVARMDRHGEMLLLLLAMVVMLDYSDAEQVAGAIASEPKLGRPSPGDKNTLNALLPEAFFTYQDELAVRAAKVADAARSKNDPELAKSFSVLTETCVGCHSSYLEEPPQMASEGQL